MIAKLECYSSCSGPAFGILKKISMCIIDVTIHYKLAELVTLEAFPEVILSI